MIRVLVWIMQFIKHRKGTCSEDISHLDVCQSPYISLKGVVDKRLEVNDIAVKELDQAETRIIKLMQQCVLGKDIDV